VLRSIKYGLYGVLVAGVVGGTAAWSHSDKTIKLLVDGRDRTIHTTASNVSGALRSAGYRLTAHDLVAPAPATAVRDGSTIVLKQGRLLHLTIDGIPRNVWTTASTVSQALSALGYGSQDAFSVSRSARLPLTPTGIQVRTPKTVTLVQNGTKRQLTTTAATVADLLDQLGVTLNSSLRLSVPAATGITDGAVVTLRRISHRTVVVTRTIPFARHVRRTSSLNKGVTKITTTGRTGRRRITYDVTYVDGKASSRRQVQAAVTRQPRAQVSEVGTHVNPQPAYNGTPGSAQAIAASMLAARGWSSQMGCLVELWNHESSWRVDAYNPSGAYGIPQALPGDKMASAGADWRTNPATQIRWGLDYIASRYGDPCGAWSTWQAHGGWY
jgi:resuscitation-promoting factor RpfB